MSYDAGLFKSRVGFQPITEGSENSGSISSAFTSQVLRNRPDVHTIFERRAKYSVLSHDFSIATPDLMEDSQYNLQDISCPHRAFQSKSNMRSELSVNKSKLLMAEASRAVIGGINVVINLDDLYIDHSINTEEGIYPEDDLLCFDRAPSGIYITKVNDPEMYPPKIKYTLIETDTLDMFEQPCISFEKGTEEANAVEAENENYLYLTIGKGKNRKRINAETQTRAKVTQTRHAQAPRPKKKNSMAFASVWDMHDTYEQLKIVEEEEEEDYMVMFQLVPKKYLRKRKLEEAKGMDDGIYRSMEQLMDNLRFRDAVLIVERILACNIFKEQQKKFRGLVAMDPLSLDLKYEYTLEILWELNCEETADHCVTYCSFNPEAADVLAVAYGKFLYNEDKGGLVGLWCMKNPRKPERLYRFETPVTSLRFSKKHPNWLACGMYDGRVLIMDVTSYTKKVIMCSDRESNPCFEPIWNIAWKIRDTSNVEYVIAICQDGRVSKFVRTDTNEFERTPMMRVTQVEGRIKGVFKLRPCYTFDVRIRRHPTCLAFAPHPTIDHIYFIGTHEGCLHKCSTNYLNQHMDVSRSHTCNMFDIQFSPFWDNLYATCGADWTVQIWVEGIDDSLITLECVGCVYGVSWCPNNSSILVSISRNMLHVWDLNRKTYSASAELRFPTGTILTFVRFSSNGDCVFIGDSVGKLYTFFLCDMPIPPFYQKRVLRDAIMRHLQTKPYLLHQLEKLENLKK